MFHKKVATETDTGELDDQGRRIVRVVEQQYIELSQLLNCDKGRCNELSLEAGKQIRLLQGEIDQRESLVRQWQTIQSIARHVADDTAPKGAMHGRY